MADKTILVVDADPETDQKITAALESEGYLVFSGVSHLVTDEMAGKLNPSLIFIRPLSPSAAGFQPCRAIHTIPKLQNVPIVLLAALKEKVQPQYTEYYGIVDFLKPTFTPGELIAKTVSVLTSAQPSAEPEQEEVEAFLPVEEEAVIEEQPAVEEPMVLNEPPSDEELPVRSESPAEEEPLGWNEPPTVDEPLSMNKPSSEQEAPPKESSDTRLAAEEESPWEDEVQKPSSSSRPLPGRTYRRGRVQKPTLLPWLIGLLVAVILGGGGFVAYERFMSPQQLTPSEPKKAVSPAAPQQKETGSSPSIAPVTTAPATAPEPAAPAQVPEPAPSVSQPVPASNKPMYAVQVAAFKTDEPAAILVKKLQGKGYEAYAQKGVTKDNAPVIRVLIGTYSDRKAANKHANEIQEKEKIKTTIFTN